MPVIRTTTVYVSSDRELIVGLPSGQQFGVSISDPSQAVTSSNNLVAYRPRYNDYHRSGLGAMFLNIPGIFPCMLSQSFHPLCGLLTAEEDGFNGGRSFIQASDVGNNFRIFNSTTDIPTYGLALEGCAEFTAACWPTYAGVGIFCLLPRHLCG